MYGKSYNSPNEERTSRVNFYNNYLRILTHNQQIANGKRGADQAVNQFSDLVRKILKNSISERNRL